MQPAIRAGRALLPLQKLLADNRERDVTAMRSSAVLEQKNSLPGAELHLAINNLHTLADARQDHPNVLLILQNPTLGRAISIELRRRQARRTSATVDLSTVSINLIRSFLASLLERRRA